MAETNNNSSNILDVEKKALKLLQECKSTYKTYKKQYMMHFRFIESSIKSIELIGENHTTFNKTIFTKIINKAKLLSSLMKTIEVNFNNYYEEFNSLDRKSISSNIVKKIDIICDDMNDAKENFNRDINKIIVYNDLLEHGKDLNDI